MSWKVSHCKGCSQPIIWAESEKGRKMPFDAKPGGGVFVLLKASDYYGLPSEDALHPMAVHISKAERFFPSLEAFANAPRYTAHHSTCPEVDSFR